MGLRTGCFVVGVDGSDASAEALRWSLRLARLTDADLVVVHAMGLLDELGGQTVPAHSHRAQIEKVVENDWCAPLHHDGIGYRTVVREGYAADVLVDEARREQAALLVVGSRGIGSTAASALGSTSLHVLQMACVPTLVVPKREIGSRHLSLRRILVGVDGVTSAHPAMELACELALTFGARVELVNAGEPVPVQVRGQLEPLRQQLSSCGVVAHVSVQRGSPDDVLRARAASIDADLIVLTSAHCGHPSEPVLEASVSRRITALAHRPTLVIPATPLSHRGDYPEAMSATGEKLRR